MWYYCAGLLISMALNESWAQDGWTPLHIASQEGHVTVVNYLIGTARANVEAADTVPHAAAGACSIDWAHAQDACTPLHVACKEGFLDVVKYLTGTAGANVEAANRVRHTVAEFDRAGGLTIFRGAACCHAAAHGLPERPFRGCGVLNGHSWRQRGGYEHGTAHSCCDP